MRLCKGLGCFRNWWGEVGAPSAMMVGESKIGLTLARSMFQTPRKCAGTIARPQFKDHLAKSAAYNPA